MIEQIKTPEVLVVGTSVCRHVSAKTPIIFEFQRKDFLTTNYANYAGGVQVEIATTDPALFTVGDEVYFFAKDITGAIVEGSAKIVLVGVNTSTTIALDLHFVSMTPVEQYLVLNTVYSEYSADFEVFDVRTDAVIPGAKQSIKSDPSGKVVFDVSPFVRDLPLLGDINFTSPANCPEIAQPFYLKTGETFDGSSTTPSRLDPNDFFAVMYYPEVGGDFGQNMGDLLAFPGNQVEEAGEFLTDFEKPTFFEGWPFSLEFIYSPGGEIDSLDFVTVQQDQNGVNLSEEEVNIFSLDLAEPLKVGITETILPATTQILASVGGIIPFSFRTNIDPGMDWTFDPSIITSSGIAIWLFEDLSIMNGNGISTTGNGLDGTSQLVKIVNLNPDVITAFDAQNDGIFGAFSAGLLENCTIYRLQDNRITVFFGPKSTNAAVNEFDISNNPWLTDLFISGFLNLQGTFDASDCALIYIDWPIGVPNAINLDLSGNSLPYMSLSAAFPSLGAGNNIVLNLEDNGLSQTEVNSYILDADRMFPSGYTGREVRLAGTNSAPNLSVPAVATAKANLISKNVQVLHS